MSKFRTFLLYFPLLTIISWLIVNIIRITIGFNPNSSDFPSWFIFYLFFSWILTIIISIYNLTWVKKEIPRRLIEISIFICLIILGLFVFLLLISPVAHP
jgi:hypothetical protein